MLYWITSVDGSLNYQCEADGVDAALLAMAQYFQFTTYPEFLTGCNYQRSDLTIATVTRQDSSEVSEHEQRQKIQADQERSEIGAFRKLRQLMG